jgi:peptidoglycan/xylan/chitin deacetylase (PgdA/CDA1 family)
MKTIALILFAAFAPLIAAASPARTLPTSRPVEIHQALQVSATPHTKTVALTLDACGGAFDKDLIDYLIACNIPATIFVTKRWLDRNPQGVAILRAHADLFQLENHGANHVPAMVGAGKRVYGMAGEPDEAHLQAEVQGGVDAIAHSTGSTAKWYRGATAMYDATAIAAIKNMGYRIAGFSLNADAGATLSQREIVARLKAAKNGDIIIAHMNKPASASAEGLAEGLSWMTAQGFKFVTLGDAAVRDLG